MFSYEARGPHLDTTTNEGGAELSPDFTTSERSNAGGITGPKIASLIPKVV